MTDPLGAATVETVGAGLGTGDAFLRFVMPAGTESYDAWSGFPNVSNRSLRLMQPVADVSLEVEARFRTTPVDASDDSIEYAIGDLMGSPGHRVSPGSRGLR